MIWLISQSNPQLYKGFTVEHEICFSEQVCLTEPNMGQNYSKLTLALSTVKYRLSVDELWKKALNPAEN